MSKAGNNLERNVLIHKPTPMLAIVPKNDVTLMCVKEDRACVKTSESPK